LSRWKRDEVGGVIGVADPVRWLARKQNPAVEEVMVRKQHPTIEVRTRPRRRASSRYEPGRGVVRHRGVNPALASCVVDLRWRWAVGGGRRRVGDLSATAGRVWRGRGRGRGRGTSWGSDHGGGGFEISRYFRSG
jgi:hypothetical protein